MSYFWSSSSTSEKPTEPEARSYLPTAEEKERMSQIRTILLGKKSEYVKDGEEEYIFSDMQVLRFLRGSKQDTESAAVKLIKHSNWRREHDVECIKDEDIQVELDKGYFIAAGTARDGRPLVWVRACQVDKYNRDMSVVYKFIIWCVEKTMKRTMPEDNRFVLVFDLNDFSLKNMDYEAVKALVSILQSNYPEVLNLALVVNSPFIFSACWAVIRPWLDPVTASKVQFVDLEGVRRQIDEVEWPAQYRTVPAVNNEAASDSATHSAS